MKKKENLVKRTCSLCTLTDLNSPIHDVFYSVSLQCRIKTGSPFRHACLNDTAIFESPLRLPKSILSLNTVLHTNEV